MRLARMTLAGFKSFADKTTIAFDEPVVGIVGPNGCGKSNVVDGIKWVLGDQSPKSLRGGAMIDVIFNGSAKRKPAGMAAVTLVFTNPERQGARSDNPTEVHRALPLDTDEVAVTRELYRDGTSDYRLNGKRVRLRDVRELFMDTGVGTDAYSIIEQGKVARMLETSGAERRQIFEEAAGISRFKARKKEAQRKLDRATANLTLVSARLEETEKRLKTVKLQAARARSFQEADQRLRAAASWRTGWPSTATSRRSAKPSTSCWRSPRRPTRWRRRRWWSARKPRRKRSEEAAEAETTRAEAERLAFEAVNARDRAQSAAVSATRGAEQVREGLGRDGQRLASLREEREASRAEAEKRAAEEAELAAAAESLAAGLGGGAGSGGAGSRRRVGEASGGGGRTQRAERPACGGRSGWRTGSPDWSGRRGRWSRRGPSWRAGRARRPRGSRSCSPSGTRTRRPPRRRRRWWGGRPRRSRRRSGGRPSWSGTRRCWPPASRPRGRSGPSGARGGTCCGKWRRPGRAWRIR